MNTKLTLIAIAAIIIAACHSTKKNTQTVTNPAPPLPTAVITPTTAPPSFLVRSESGIIEPGNDELTAIQVEYKGVTLDKLKDGHLIYIGSECTGCHGAKNIYKRELSRWKGIIDNMAIKAKISDTQKDALYKYVLAVKATQPK